MVSEIQADVACIGGGPACAFAALEILKSQTVSVSIFEEHKEIGLPINCAGLISVDGFKKLGIKVPEDCIQHKVNGSIFYSPSGHSFRVSRKKTQALVIDREKFDKFLMEKVERMNGKVYLNSKVNSIIKNNERIIGLEVRDKERIKCKLIIDGEGVNARFLNQVGLSSTRRDYLIPTIQYDMEDVDVNEKLVEIYLGRKVAPGFFAYIIPTSNTSARVAAGSKFGNSSDYLKNFIKNHPIVSEKLNKGTITRKGGGYVHLGGPIKKTYAAGFLGVGDAVGHVKATTGGGVIFGGLCARIAGKIAVQAINNNDLSGSFLKKYQVEWQRRYLGELRLMKLLRSILNAVPDKMLDEIFLSLSNQHIPELIEEIGDMDMQGALIRKMLFSPRILKLLFGILIGFIAH